MSPSVALGIPFWGDDPMRVRNYQYVWRKMTQIVEPDGVIQGSSGVVGRGRQRNHIARMALAGDFDVMVVCDADTFVEPEGLHEAINRVYNEGGLIYPYNGYRYLTEGATEDLIAGVLDPDPPTTMSGPGSYGGCFVMRPQDWADVGGMIELDGWGFEDIVFSIQARLLLKDLQWTPGRLTHLYHHSEAVPMTDEYKNNIRICKEFETVFEHPRGWDQLSHLAYIMDKYTALFPKEWMDS